MSELMKDPHKLPQRLHLKVVAAVLQAIAETEHWDGEKHSIEQIKPNGGWMTTIAGHPMPSTSLLALANDRYRQMLEQERKR